MLFLLEVADLSPVIIDLMSSVSDQNKVYVVSKEVYSELRNRGDINIDLAFLEDNHIYLVDGQIHDEINIFLMDLTLIMRYGRFCDAFTFYSTHKVHTLGGEDF